MDTDSPHADSDTSSVVLRVSRTSFVAIAMILAGWMVFPRLLLPPSFDATNAYLPMARHVLSEGWAYLQRPESLAYGPVAFLYPALLGANEMTVRYANVGLYVAAVMLGYVTVSKTQSWQAGTAAAFLLALSPTLQPFMADALSEPPFVFLMAIWALAVSSASREGGSSGAWIVAGGVALGLATLARPAAMYFAPLMIAIFGLRWWRTRRAPFGKLAAMHAIALAISAAWIARNAMVFGFPSIATGAGAALWFGANPLVDGYEPAYFGLDYDSGLVQQDTTHLTIKADRVLRAVAAVELRDTPLAVLAEMCLHKAGAFLFVTSAETSSEPVAFMRMWRIALATLAVAAIIFRRKSPIVVALGILVAYMVAVHIPVMYHYRYSVGALDLPLTLLAAIGLAEAARSVPRAAAMIFAATLGVGLGLAEMAHAGPRSPMPDRIALEVLWMRNIGTTHVVGPGEPPIDFSITKDPTTFRWDLTMLEMELSVSPLVKRGVCDRLRIRFRTPGEKDFAVRRPVRVPITSDGRMHKLVIGTSYPISLRGEGVVRLDFECSSPAAVEIGQVAVLSPLRQQYYWDLYQRQRQEEKRP